jgi:MFS family permease
VGLFISSAPLASTFSGALAYGITSGHSKLAPWRLLFLVEGLATFLMIPVTYMFLPDSPDKARFLNEKERAIAKSRAIRQAGTAERTGRGGFQVKEMLSTAGQVQVWVIAVGMTIDSQRHAD